MTHPGQARNWGVQAGPAPCSRQAERVLRRDRMRRVASANAARPPRRGFARIGDAVAGSVQAHDRRADAGAGRQASIAPRARAAGERPVGEIERSARRSRSDGLAVLRDAQMLARSSTESAPAAAANRRPMPGATPGQRAVADEDVGAGREAPLGEVAAAAVAAVVAAAAAARRGCSRAG